MSSAGTSFVQCESPTHCHTAKDNVRLDSNAISPWITRVHSCEREKKIFFPIQWCMNAINFLSFFCPSCPPLKRRTKKNTRNNFWFIVTALTTFICQMLNLFPKSSLSLSLFIILFSKNLNPTQNKVKKNYKINLQIKTNFIISFTFLVFENQEEIIKKNQ